jgi:hypothetical protein
VLLDRAALPQRGGDLVDQAAVELLRADVGADVGLLEGVLDGLFEVGVVVHRGVGVHDVGDLAREHAFEQRPWLGCGGGDPVRARPGAQAEPQLVVGLIHIAPGGKFLQDRQA